MQAVFRLFLVENVAQFIFCKYFLVRGIMDKIGFEGVIFMDAKEEKC